MNNLADRFLAEHGYSLLDYHGRCSQLVTAMSLWLINNFEMRSLIITIIPIKSTFLLSVLGSVWKFHSIIIVNGTVHDPWCDKVLSLPDYLKYMFPYQNTHVVKDVSIAMNIMGVI